MLLTRHFQLALFAILSLSEWPQNLLPHTWSLLQSWQKVVFRHGTSIQRQHQKSVQSAAYTCMESNAYLHACLVFRTNPRGEVETLFRSVALHSSDCHTSCKATSSNWDVTCCKFVPSGTHVGSIVQTASLVTRPKNSCDKFHYDAYFICTGDVLANSVHHHCSLSVWKQNAFSKHALYDVHIQKMFQARQWHRM